MVPDIFDAWSRVLLQHILRIAALEVEVARLKLQLHKATMKELK